MLKIEKMSFDEESCPTKVETWMKINEIIDAVNNFITPKGEPPSGRAEKEERKVWCPHIKWMKRGMVSLAPDYWGYCGLFGSNQPQNVCEKWVVCPDCKTPRPTKNPEAEKLRHNMGAMGVGSMPESLLKPEPKTLWETLRDARQLAYGGEKHDLLEDKMVFSYVAASAIEWACEKVEEVWKEENGCSANDVRLGKKLLARLRSR